MENFFPEHISKYLYPVLIFVLSFIAGLVVERILIVHLRKFALKTRWKGDDIIFESLKGILIIISIIAGIYISLSIISIEKKYFLLAQKILIVLLIFTVTIFLKRLSVGIVDSRMRKDDKTFITPSILTNIVKIIIYAVGILIILQSLKIPITPILTALGVGGLAIALALQSTLSNLFAGLYIIVSKHIKPGDYVKLDSGQEGYVTDITWRNATIREVPGNIIIVPNSKLAEAIVKNYYLPRQELLVLIDVGVSYGSDLEKVEKVTLEIAEEVMKSISGGIPDFKPFLRYHTFDDFSINFTVHMKGAEFYDQYLVKHEFIKKLHKRYNEEGIEIPFPIRTVHMKKEKD
ncbi:mechanosensitive ion channel family protein [candidate division KSB1 bacterium]